MATAGEGTSEDNGGAEAAALDWPARLALAEGLAAVVADERLSELEVETGGVRIIVRSPAPLAPPMPHQSGAAPAYYPAHTPDLGMAGEAHEGAEPAAHEPNLVPIVSPMVGVFYRASSPDNPPLVEVNDFVEVGHVIGIIEAMKVFNEIAAEVEGTVAEIRAQNAELVETGAPLVIIRTA